MSWPAIVGLFNYLKEYMIIKILKAWYDPAVGAFYIEGENMKNLPESILKRLIPVYEIK